MRTIEGKSNSEDLEFVSCLRPQGDVNHGQEVMTRTVDLSDEQIKYLRRLVAWDVSTQQQNVRRLSDPNNFEQMRADANNDIRIGSEIIGKLP